MTTMRANESSVALGSTSELWSIPFSWLYQTFVCFLWLAPTDASGVVGQHDPLEIPYIRLDQKTKVLELC